MTVVSIRRCKGVLFSGLPQRQFFVTMEHMQHITDHELIKRYIKGDQRSFEVLVSRYMDLMYRFVYKYVNNPETAKDITQEVFLKVWRNVKKIDQDKNFKSWI